MEDNPQCTGWSPKRPLSTVRRDSAKVVYNSLLMTANTSTSAPAAAKASSAAKAIAKLSPTPGALKSPITLAIDIGGSGLKAMLLDAAGKPVSERERVVTPAVPTPKAVLAALDGLVALLPRFDRVSAGFPGVVKRGITYTAVNLHPDWMNFNFQAELEKRWKKPARVTNDASVQGYGVVQGKGVELLLTLGTGMGSAIFTDGKLCPGLELGHHPWKKKTYEDYLGRRGLDKFGKKEWNKYLQEAIGQIEKLFNWDQCYLGGGNTKKIDFTLPKGVKIVSNEAGILGGVALWRDLK
jgi:polyphosphate glucokinase